jgi:hypothetical protein
MLPIYAGVGRGGAREPDSVIKVCIASRVGAPDLALLRAHANAFSAAAPIAPDIVQLALLRALERRAPWPALNLGAATAKGDSAGVVFFRQAHVVGREGTKAMAPGNDARAAYEAIGWGVEVATC